MTEDDSTSASLQIKKVNPDLWEIVQKHVITAPDPRSYRVRKTYDEIWSPSLSWNRLLHELQSISMDIDGTQVLYDLQNTNLWKRRHLREMLIEWRDTYPMLWWALGYTSPVPMLYAHISLGEITSRTLASKEITPILIDHIRDIHTAKIIRTIRSTIPRIADTDKSLETSLKSERIGKIYWIVSAIIPNNSITLRNIILKIIKRDDDEELLRPLVETLSKGLISDSIDFVRQISRNPMTLSSKSFPSFFRLLWDSFIAEYTSGYSSQSISRIDVRLSPVIYFLHRLFKTIRYFLDEDFAEYIIRSYLVRVDDGRLPYKRILSLFTDRVYSQVWSLIIPYISNELPLNIETVIMQAHELGLEDIAKAYKMVYIKKIENNISEIDIRYFRDYGSNVNGIVYIFADISPKVQRELLATIPIYISDYYYEWALTTETNSKNRRLIAIHFLKVFLNRVNISTISSSLLTLIKNQLSKRDVESVLLVDTIANGESLGEYLYANNYTNLLALVRILPTELLSEKLWNAGSGSHEFLHILVERLGLPTMETVIEAIKSSYRSIDILRVIPRKVLDEYVAKGLLSSLSIDKNLIISELFKIPIDMIYGDKFYSTIRLLKAQQNVLLSKIIDTVSINIDWNALVSIYSEEISSESKETLIALREKGVDFSYKSSSILLEILASGSTNKEKQELLQCVSTPIALAKLSPKVRKEVEDLLRTVLPDKS